MLLRRISLPALIQYLALLIGAILIAGNLYQEGGPWWLALILCAALGIIYDHWPFGFNHIYFAVQLTLIALLITLHPFGMMAGFAFSAEVMSFYPNRAGVRWMAALVVVAAVTLIATLDWSDGIAAGLGVSLGYISFGQFTYARVNSEGERRRSQALLAELQEAHRRLEDYAAQVETLAVQAERERMAREMHDTLGHRLTVAAVQLEGAERLIPGDPQRAAQMIAVVRGQVSEALAELRRTVTALRLPVEADLPLDAALRRLAAGFEDAAGVRVHLALPEPPAELPGAQRLALYRAAQEGLTNVQRHAHARQVWLELALTDGQACLTVADDGAGLPAEPPASGFGLRGLQERAAHLGGRLQLEPRPAGGALLSFAIPIGPEQENHGEPDPHPACG